MKSLSWASLSSAETQRFGCWGRPGEWVLEDVLPQDRRGVAATHLPPLCHQGEWLPRESKCAGLFSQQLRDEERALVLGAGMGKLRQKSSHINCPKMGPWRAWLRGNS